MSYTLMTSFNEKYWQEIAKDNSKLFDKFWPADCDILLYHQLPVIEHTSMSHRVKWIDLYKNCPDLVAFANKWKDNTRANGISPKKNAFRWNAIKFAHKTFAIWNAAKRIKSGWLVWIDCDAFIFNTIDKKFLDTVFPKNKHICYLGRKGKYSECGFMGFDLNHPQVQKFMIDWENLYLSGDFINLAPESM